jgi:hypothetical protein
VQKSRHRSSLRVVGLLLFVVTSISWLVFHRLGSLPGNDITKAEAEGAVQRPVLYWLYYWHHTSTWWAALAAILGTVSSATLGACLLRLAVRSTFARSKIIGALVAVVGWAAWLCGAAFLALLALVVWFTADLEGTQTEVPGPDGRQVLVTLDNSGYHWVRVWRQDTSTRYVEEPGRAAVDPSRGPCTLTRPGEDLILRCGPTSQTLKP